MCNYKTHLQYFTIIILGAWGSLVVKALRYFPLFLLTKPCALRSTQRLKMSIRDFFWGKGDRCVWLTTYHPCSAERRDDPGP